MKITLSIVEASQLEVYYLKAYLPLDVGIMWAFTPDVILNDPNLMQELQIPSWMVGLARSREITPLDGFVQFDVTDSVEQDHLLGHFCVGLVGGRQNEDKFERLLSCILHLPEDKFEFMLTEGERLYNLDHAKGRYLTPWPKWFSTFARDYRKERGLPKAHELSSTQSS